MAGLFRMSRQLGQLPSRWCILSPIRGNVLDSATSIKNGYGTFVKSCGCFAEKTSQYTNPQRNAGSTTERFHRPSLGEKRLLIWTKMYAKYEDIPESVSQNKITKAKDLMRIRGCILMIILTLFGCALMIHTGRKARDQGDTIRKRGIEYMDEMAIKGRKERELQAAKKE